MKDILRKQLDELIKKNVRLFNLQMKKKRDEPFLLCEEYHLSTGIENELFSWELQQTIGITENGKIHMMMFMHPIIVDDNNHREFIEFANAANLWLGSSLGRFWINQDNDFCYECYLPKLLIDHLEELEQQLQELSEAEKAALEIKEKLIQHIRSMRYQQNNWFNEEINSTELHF